MKPYPKETIFNIPGPDPGPVHGLMHGISTSPFLFHPPLANLLMLSSLTCFGVQRKALVH